jgi:hypothetical protein
MSVDAIIAEVEHCSGAQFDPAIAATFVRIARRSHGALIVNSARQVDRRFDHTNPLSAQDPRGMLARVYQPAG